MTKLYAQPYDVSASGFYFESLEDYQTKAHAARNDYGQPVEEFEIQFIDGDDLDTDLFQALRIHQGNIGAYFDAVDTWDEDDKIKTIIAVSECGYSFDLERGTPSEFDVDLYICSSLRELAMRFVEEGLFGEIPASIEHYIDYDAIARDLGIDYGEVTLNGTHYVYRVV